MRKSYIGNCKKVKAPSNKTLILQRVLMIKTMKILPIGMQNVGRKDAHT